MLDNTNNTTQDETTTKVERSKLIAERSAQTLCVNNDLRSNFIRQFEGYALNAVEQNERSIIKNDVCEALIHACIKTGIDTRDGIVRRVPRLFETTHRHVAYRLDHLTGTDPEVHLWVKGANKRYSILKR